MPFFIPTHLGLAKKRRRHYHEKQLEDQIRSAIEDGHTVGVYSSSGFIRIKPHAIRVFGPNQQQGRLITQYDLQDQEAIERE